MNIFKKKEKKVSRIEIIGEGGNLYVKQLPHYQLGKIEFQDGGKTIKIYIEDFLQKDDACETGCGTGSGCESDD